MNALPKSAQRFDTLAYWQAVHRAADPRPVFKFPLTRCDLMQPQELDEINARVFEIVARSWQGPDFQGADMRDPAERRRLVEALNGTTRYGIDVQGNLDRFVALELPLIDLFTRLGFMQGIVGWQFPLDIRVVHPEPPEGYLARRDATDYLHCDPWRGEPEDLVNVVLYCEVGDDASQLELYVVAPEELPRFQAYRGDEKQSEYLLEGRPPVDFQHRPGQVVIFDGYLPHRTRRHGDAVRISLNFSLRRLDPYAVIDERWDRPRQAWQKFWYVNEARSTTFAERCAHELQRIPGAEALAARQAALTKHFQANY